MELAQCRKQPKGGPFPLKSPFSPQNVGKTNGGPLEKISESCTGPKNQRGPFAFLYQR